MLMLRPSRGRHGWIVIVVAVLLAAWLISAGIAATIIALFFPGGFLIAP
jgi:hypothetical protein